MWKERLKYKRLFTSDTFAIFILFIIQLHHNERVVLSIWHWAPRCEVVLVFANHCNSFSTKGGKTFFVFICVFVFVFVFHIVLVFISIFHIVLVFANHCNSFSTKGGKKPSFCVFSYVFVFCIYLYLYFY